MSWIGAIIGGVTGGIQMGIAMDELSKLPSAKTFSPATDLETATSMARRAAQQGMTPQERAAAEQAIGTAQSRTQRAMEQRGLGNLAAAVSQIRTTEAINQLEAQNQAIKRQSLGQYASLAGQMQSIQNQNIQSFNQMLYAQQQALGQAAQAGFRNLAGTGASIAEAIEGKQAVDDKTFETTPGGQVTTGQMGVTDTTTPATTPMSTTSGISGVGGVGATAPGVAAEGTAEGSGIPFMFSDGLTPIATTPAYTFISDVEPKFSPTISPFGNIADERSFQDYANTQAGYDITKGYGWGPASSAAYGIYGQDYRSLMGIQ